MIQKKEHMHVVQEGEASFDLTSLREAMDVSTHSTQALIESLPFAGRDTTAGAENEFQTVVTGKRQDLDLALTIEESNYYKNLIRRANSGDTSRKKLVGIERYLEQKKDCVWENSWVRFPEECLNTYARHIFRSDLKSDKTDPKSDIRSDAHRFHIKKDEKEYVRIPVSYLLKLSLADALGDNLCLHPYIRITGEKMMAHFSNDNTSPEIFSFQPVRALSTESVGTELARETLIRFLLTQLLVDYAQDKFKLTENGQQVRVFFSSSPPMMQKQLNDCISDSFYRHLFMSPCLSGWSRGMEKFEYMKLCHQVLSRSQINGIAKLKEAGIINSNLVILPNSSNVCLANNGTHISIGSKKLSALLQNAASGFTSVQEKYLGDLVIKITEHFLPLFPGTYSASPYRLNFEDFHPEKVLGFLPHEIDYTHLRMIWRRWKRKARISILGNPVTPFGPVWADRLLSRVFGLKGDYIPDYRLIDYFISLMSTDQSPSLNGVVGNGDLLKKDLADMGIFNTKMPMYQMVRLREYASMGYSGFEHRYFSIFENIMEDMAKAADLQNLITALAYQYILTGKISHDSIPDTPGIESERRQIFFCSAIDLPTFFVKTKTNNQFLKRIVLKITKTRQSRRYPGYTRIRMTDYKKALIDVLREDGRELIQNQNLSGTLSDLELRIKSVHTHSTGGKLVKGILKNSRVKKPMAFSGERFNKKAEEYYIEDLRKKQINEGFTELEKEFQQMDLWASFRDPSFSDAVKSILKQTDLMSFLDSFLKSYQDNALARKDIRQMILLIILYVNQKNKTFQSK